MGILWARMSAIGCIVLKTAWYRRFHLRHKIGHVRRSAAAIFSGSYRRNYMYV